MAKLLIIDDDPLLIRMYQKKFQVDGYTVSVANDGAIGLEKVKSDKPDLILLDIMMPKMNGLEFLKKLKGNASTKSIPVILLTNVSGSEEDIETGLSLGAVSYLVKSNYTPKEVVQKVKEILNASSKSLPQVKTLIKDKN